ncbi:MAG TPA: hypothetical protein VFF60_05360 [Candidatus Binatus sp.]|nr:hypothetical protein [Candidatus Binatus sp.]
METPSARKAVATFAAFIAAASLPLQASAGTIPSGTTLHTTLNLSLNTKSAYVGQPISLLVTQPYPSGGASLQGSKIYGHVTKVQKAGQGRNPELELTVDSILLAGATQRLPMQAAISKIAPKQGPNVLYGAAGALAGMLVGNWIGKMVGTNAGGAIGVAGGFLLASNNKKDITVPEGSEVSVQLSAPLTLASPR